MTTMRLSADALVPLARIETAVVKPVPQPDGPTLYAICVTTENGQIVWGAPMEQEAARNGLELIAEALRYV